MTYPPVRLTRTLPAPRDRVYRAWLDPDVVRRWLAPVGFDVARAEVDERVGGRLAAWHVDADGHEVGGFESEVLELVPPERIVLAWRFVGSDRLEGDTQETRLTVIMQEPAPGTTELTLVHERLDALAAAHPEIAGQVENGWTGTLDRLLRDLSGDH